MKASPPKHHAAPAVEQSFQDDIVDPGLDGTGG